MLTCGSEFALLHRNANGMQSLPDNAFPGRAGERETMHPCTRSRTAWKAILQVHYGSTITVVSAAVTGVWLRPLVRRALNSA